MNEAVALDSDAINFDLQQVDCMIAVMLKILDGKCKMEPRAQAMAGAVYRRMDKDSSELFDLDIFQFIGQVQQQPDPLSLKQVHALRLYAEASIPKSVMKAFKQELWRLMA
ncbi:MAG: hypothetical protein AB2813_08160 [Candidatus Sedimenticola endophacoides]